MKSPLLLSVLALAAGIGALVVSLTARPGPAGPALPAVEPAAPSPDAALLARLEELSRESADLRDRVALLELRPVGGAREEADEGEAPYLTRAEFEAFREELEARLVRAGLVPGGAAGGDEGFQERVAESLKAIQKDRRTEALAGKLDDAARAVDEKWLPALREQLDLSAGQEPLVREAFLRKVDRDQELVRLWQEGNHTDQELGAIKSDNEAALTEELSGILGPDQLERYQSSVRGGKQ